MTDWPPKDVDWPSKEGTLNCCEEAREEFINALTKVSSVVIGQSGHVSHMDPKQVKIFEDNYRSFPCEILRSYMETLLLNKRDTHPLNIEIKRILDKWKECDKGDWPEVSDTWGKSNNISHWFGIIKNDLPMPGFPNWEEDSEANWPKRNEITVTPEMTEVDPNKPEIDECCEEARAAFISFLNQAGNYALDVLGEKIHWPQLTDDQKNKFRQELNDIPCEVFRPIIEQTLSTHPGNPGRLAVQEILNDWDNCIMERTVGKPPEGHEYIQASNDKNKDWWDTLKEVGAVLSTTPGIFNVEYMKKPKSRKKDCGCGCNTCG